VQAQGARRVAVRAREALRRGRDTPAPAGPPPKEVFFLAASERERDAWVRAAKLDPADGALVAHAVQLCVDAKEIGIAKSVMFTTDMSRLAGREQTKSRPNATATRLPITKPANAVRTVPHTCAG
jgi:hypothetical protein